MSADHVRLNAPLGDGPWALATLHLCRGPGILLGDARLPALRDSLVHPRAPAARADASSHTEMRHDFSTA